MSNSIEEKMESVNSTTSVGIEICNKTLNKKLTNPKIYIHSGKVHTSPSSTINQRQKGVCVFINDPDRDCGAVGVLSYNIDETQISLLVSKPYNCEMYSFKFALYVPNKTTLTDNNLYKKMSKDLKQSDSFMKASLGKRNSCLHFTICDIYFSATISFGDKVILKIDIRDA